MFTIQPGEKWAAICYSRAWCQDLDEETQIDKDVWILRRRPIDFPPPFAQSIGSARFYLVDDANLWLIAKMASTHPHVYDEETRQLLTKVSTLLLALHTAIPLQSEACFAMNGGIENGTPEFQDTRNYPIILSRGDYLLRLSATVWWQRRQT